MIISFEGKLPQKLLILSSDCIEETLDYCLWCLFLDTKNNKYGFSCLKFFVVAVGISVSLWINYLNIWNNWSENGFYRSEFKPKFCGCIIYLKIGKIAVRLVNAVTPTKKVKIPIFLPIIIIQLK